MVYPIIVILLVVIDQMLKYNFWHYLEINGDLVIFPWLNLSLAFNTGAAWSFLADTNFGIYLLIFCSLFCSVALACYFYCFRRQLDAPAKLGLALIIAGSLGNLCDRVYLHKVVDFVDFHLGNWHFPTFNGADSYITLGILLLLLLLLTGRLHLPLLYENKKLTGETDGRNK